MSQSVTKFGIPLVLVSGLFLAAPISMRAEAFASPMQAEQAPQKQICKGIVTDQEGEPLIGAAVLVKETSIGVNTDVEGRFSLAVLPGQTLVVSYVGCMPQEVAAEFGSEMKIVLTDNANVLDDVVVVGYGTMRKKDLTGSVFQVKAEDRQKEAPRSVQDLLRNVPGMNIGYDASANGSGASIEIRGQNSLGTSSSPLIILDGMMFYGGLSEINPNDVAQIDVLKDASAAAVYGAKAANGVIIITTKKGEGQKASVTLQADWTYNTMGNNNRKVYDPQGYMDYRRDWMVAGTYGMNDSGQYVEYATGNPGMYEYPSAENLAKYGIDRDTWRSYTKGVTDDTTDKMIFASRMGLTSTPYDNYLEDRTFDWYDYALGNAWSENYNLGVSGGLGNTNYYISMGYLKNRGLARGNDYQTFRANIKVNSEITSWFELGANINFQDRTDSDTSMSWDDAIQRNSPYANYVDKDGNLDPYPMGNVAGNSGDNHDYYWKYADKESGSTILNSIFFARVKLPFGISYTFNASPRYSWYHYSDFYSNAADNRSKSEANRNNNRKFDWSINNTLAWDYTFNRVHHFNVTLVQEAERRKSWSENMYASDLQPSDALGWHLVDIADMTASKISSYDSQETADGMLARIHYGYDSRYLITGSVRRDGYSAFGTTNPRATFYSGALAWVFSNESIFHWEPMSYGKLRVSIGENGNRSLGDIYLALANLGRGNGAKYGYYSSGKVTDYVYFIMDRLANPNLKWEKTTSWNVGADLGFINNRINANIDVYRQPTTQMIMNQSLPAFSGFSSITTNLGEVVNSGFELSLSTINIQNSNFMWTSTFSFGYNKNEIKHLYYEYEDILDDKGNVIGTKETDDVSNNWFIGRPISNVWNYKVTGIWQVSEAEEAAKYNQRPGDPKVWNNPDNDIYNEDGTLKSVVYNNDDKVHMGQTTPKYNWSMRHEFTLWKSLVISLNLYGKAGHLKSETNYLNRDNVESKFTYGWNRYTKDYWTIDNPSNKYGRLDARGPAGCEVPNRYHKGDFVRLENVSVAYTLPEAWTHRIGLNRVTVNGSIRNAFVWARDWEYWDPQTNSLAPRAFNIGLNVNF